MLVTITSNVKKLQQYILRDANSNCCSSGISKTYFRNLVTFSNIPNISPLKFCNMLQNALTQDKLQYLLAWYPHPRSQKHSWQLYFMLFSVFNFAISTCFFFVETWGPQSSRPPCEMEKTVSQTSQKAWLSPIFNGFSTGQRFVYSGMNFCNVLRFFAGEAIFQTMTWVLSLAAFYQLQSTFSNEEQHANQSVIYYRCSGIIITAT